MSSARATLVSVMKEFRFLMLVTYGVDQGISARPMSVADVTDAGEVFLTTRRDSQIVKDLEADPAVQLIYQSSTQFASVSGHGTTSTDRRLIERLWKADWKVWYPGGVNDQSIVIIRIEPRLGEYWDQSGLKGAQFLFNSLVGLAKGEEPAIPDNQHAKVVL
jgi:general stress protein 26